MAKSFAPRVSKNERKTIDLSDKLGRDVFKFSDDKLLRDAKLDEIELKTIRVKEQVRTKFNDASLRELAENIRVNGLIQPLVVHQDRGGFTLICGERRFRAMSLLKLEKAPCFVLTGKSEKELMAIQFSENSSREELHYIDKADGILNYKQATGASERKITAALGISKSEVHRSLLIAKLPMKIKEAAKMYDIEKYVLVEFEEIDSNEEKKKIEELICKGEITKRTHMQAKLKKSPKAGAGAKAASATNADLLKILSSKSKDFKLDAKTKAMLKNLVLEQDSLNN
jgi:ParB family transcriptional regulator, chromosome partitioning protein